MRLTVDILAAATGAPKVRASVFAADLADACAFYRIDTPQRLAAFLAQLGHESGSLRYVQEIASGEAYEGRRDLGNTQPGDGKRYKGRGLIQTTGRANYTVVRDRLRERGLDAPDFVADPDALEAPRWAAWSAADYWDMRGLNALADRDHFIQIGRAINRGNPRSDKPANGEDDRHRRWEIARAALSATADRPAPVETIEVPKEAPVSPFIAAALPSIVSAIPTLGKLFGSGSAVAERNVAAAELAVNIVQQAVGASNAQEAAEKLADPAVAKTAAAAVEERWYELQEAGGGGIAGARKADAAFRAEGGPWWDVFRSPSFWWALLMVPPVYAVIGSVVGLWGQEWPADVRAAIATAVVSLIVGGGAGYYWGQTTSRNRGPVGPQTVK